MDRPDAISRIATIGPVLLLPLLVGGWRNVAIFLGIALLAGITSAVIARDDDPEVDQADDRRPPPDR